MLEIQSLDVRIPAEIIHNWGWHALSGLITLLLGILVLAQWPVSGLWVIGLFVGIELLFYGGAWIALALDLRSLR